MSTTRPARFKHALLFLAIVWGVASTFVAIEMISLHGMDFVSQHPSWFGRLALSNATQHSTACDAPPSRPSTGATLLSAADARAGSWILGVSFGQDAQARQSTTIDPAVLESSASRLRQLSGLLATAPPRPFTPQRQLLANTEFVEALERDADGTAHGLAVAYSPAACQLYKLGGFWGYATLSRFALRGAPSMFGIEIGYYAQRAGLPGTLWRPMIARTPQTATVEQINEESARLTTAVTQYLSSAR